MKLALRRIKVYLKLAAMAAAGLLLLLVVLANRGRTADIWFIYDHRGVPVLWLIVLTAVISVTGWWAFLKILAVVRDMRELKRLEAEESRLREQRRLAEEMAEREKRIDEKVRRSLSEAADQAG